MRAKPIQRWEKVLLVLVLALVIWTIANYGSTTALAQEPPPPWWGADTPAPADDPSMIARSRVEYVSPYGVVVRYSYYQARQFANDVAKLYSQGYEIVASGKLGMQDAVFMNGVMDWNYAAGMAANTMNAAAAGPPRAIYNCAMDPCCLYPSSCETVYQ